MAIVSISTAIAWCCRPSRSFSAALFATRLTVNNGPTCKPEGKFDWLDAKLKSIANCSPDSLTRQSGITISPDFKSGRKPPANPAETTQRGRCPAINNSVAWVARFCPTPAVTTTTPLFFQPPCLAVKSFPRMESTPVNRFSNAVASSAKA
jgi:hypothetical protein